MTGTDDEGDSGRDAPICKKLLDLLILSLRLVVEFTSRSVRINTINSRLD